MYVLEGQNTVEPAAEGGRLVISVIVDLATGALDVATDGPLDIRHGIGYLELAKTQLQMDYFARAEAMRTRTQPRIIQASGPLPNFG